jgi:hypothetical protein
MDWTIDQYGNRFHVQTTYADDEWAVLNTINQDGKKFGDSSYALDSFFPKEPQKALCWSHSLI